MNEITISLETLTVQGIQALDPNDNYCPKQPIFQNTAQCVGVAAASASLYSDAETAVGVNAYHSEKSPELPHQEDLRDRSQIHSRVLLLIQNPKSKIDRLWTLRTTMALRDGIMGRLGNESNCAAIPINGSIFSVVSLPYPLCSKVI